MVIDSLGEKSNAGNGNSIDNFRKQTLSKLGEIHDVILADGDCSKEANSLLTAFVNRGFDSQKNKESLRKTLEEVMSKGTDLETLQQMIMNGKKREFGDYMRDVMKKVVLNGSYFKKKNNLE